ncbi:hypothetical protein LEP1GSC163_0192 [Leptospira santarosai str. CBC379]|uniref:hypothetical protein n=1 Tax=Leptospira santarosai TaxID=28183 RepID=UPI000297CE46|nr:hypothetical protein [Leptospira santarosai]EKR89729.1 hypothetical protein LEP1GSC163_0192 [Leptospira santarosai str. CBC379]
MPSPSSSLSLFISIDLVGSTAFKNGYRKTGNEQPWLDFFESFYRDVPNQLKSFIGAEKSYCPIIWKTVGDEIVFTCSITKKDQCKNIILGLYNTIIRYHSELALRALPLKIKATAWLVGFPVINAKIKIEDGSGVRDDYIGPSVDVGFRLTKYADSRNLILSVELAYVLSDTLTSSDEDILLGGLFLEKEEILKGAFNGIPYPIFSIKIQDEFEKSRLNVFKKTKVENVDLKNYCKEYIKQVNDPYVIVLPYIKCQSEEPYNGIPEAHEEVIQNLLKKEMGDYEKNRKPEEILETGEERLEVSDEIKKMN